MKRSATAVWQGTIKEGQGTLSTQSKTLSSTPYSFVSRFENGAGTNPEELLAAAHAGCFTMMLSSLLTKEGFTPKQIDTQADITLDPASGTITTSQLTVKAQMPGIEQAKFAEIAKNAEQNCPVSKLFKAEIKLSFTLN